MEDLVQPIKKIKKMIVDLNEIKKLQKKYQNDHIALNALQNMVNVVSQSRVEELKGSIALTTLMSLGVLTEEIEKKKPTQLNS